MALLLINEHLMRNQYIAYCAHFKILPGKSERYFRRDNAAEA